MTIMTVFDASIQRVRRATLKRISEDLLSRYTLQEIREIISDSYVQNYLGYSIENESDLLDLLIDLSKWKNEYFFLSLLDFLCDPRLFGGDIQQSAKVQLYYFGLLKGEGLDYGQGRWWIVPHYKQAKFGDDLYRNSSGEVYGEDFLPDLVDQSLPIKSITFIKPSGRNTSYSFYINDDYSNIGKARSSSKNIMSFIKIAGSESQSANFDKALLDYINYDKRNVLYQCSKCRTTTVLVRNGDRMGINELVNIKFVDQSRHKANLSRLTK